MPAKSREILHSRCIFIPVGLAVFLAFSSHSGTRLSVRNSFMLNELKIHERPIFSEPFISEWNKLKIGVSFVNIAQFLIQVSFDNLLNRCEISHLTTQSFSRVYSSALMLAQLEPCVKQNTVYTIQEKIKTQTFPIVLSTMIGRICRFSKSISKPTTILAKMCALLQLASSPDISSWINCSRRII